MEGNNNKIMFHYEIKVADNFFKKLVGLLGRKNMRQNEGLLLKNCSSIHCFFMRFPIDVVYLSKDMIVIFIETVAPWRVGRLIRGTKHILELDQGGANHLRVGDRLLIKY
ncbi:MAG: DUF192 domain-containing protein [Bacillota bacterium]